MYKTRGLIICLFILTLFISSCQSDLQTFSFKSYPDGTAVILDSLDESGEPYHRIREDQFSEWGFLLSSAPEDNCLAIKESLNQDIDDLYLCLCTITECGNAHRLEIEFNEPVKSVDVGFVGAYYSYTMQVFDPMGEVIDTPLVLCSGRLDGTLTHLTYTSKTANIKKISLGTKVEMPLSGIYIKEIMIER
jgi:hypothetical protein